MNKRHVQEKFQIGGKKINRFFHMLIWKTGGSSTSDRNFMSFHEWKDITHFYHEWKIRRCSISTHKSTYFFLKQHLFSYTHTYVWFSLIDISFTYQVLLCTTSQYVTEKCRSQSILCCFTIKRALIQEQIIFVIFYDLFLKITVRSDWSTSDGR